MKRKLYLTLFSLLLVAPITSLKAAIDTESEKKINGIGISRKEISYYIDFWCGKKISTGFRNGLDNQKELKKLEAYERKTTKKGYEIKVDHLLQIRVKASDIKSAYKDKFNKIYSPTQESDVTVLLDVLNFMLKDKYKGCFQNLGYQSRKIIF